MRFLLLLLLLGACASQPGAPQGPPNQVTVAVADLAKFTTADLNAALADATAHNDPYGQACYPALIKFVGTLAVAPAVPQVAGAFSAFQLGRDALRSAAGATALPDYVVIGCAGLAQSAGMDLAQLLVKMAGLAAAPNPLSAMGVVFPILGTALRVGPAAAEMGGVL